MVPMQRAHACVFCRRRENETALTPGKTLRLAAKRAEMTPAGGLLRD